MIYYQFYRTPRLTVQREEAGTNIKISDGRLLLRSPLTATATDEELIAAAYKEIMFLVARDLVNIIPLLREYDTEQPCIRIPIQEATKFRRMAFLRGHIPYLTRGLAKLIGKAYWVRATKAHKNVPEIFQGNLEKMQVYSCDWVCGELPEHLHDDIYANGKPGGGRGFNREEIFVTADEEGIVISSIPEHPLERQRISLEVGPDKERPKMRNDLRPLPEDMKVSPKFYNVDKDFVLATREQGGATLSDKTFSSIIMRIKADARQPIYRIDAEPANRYQMMQYIPWAITEGRTLRDICKGINGTPSMLEIARWLQYYPDFRRELEQAETIQAQVFMDYAQEIIMGLEPETSKEARGVAKAQTNFLMKRAALQSPKFIEKKVIQTENLDMKNEAEVKRKLKMLLRGEAVSDIIELEPLEPVSHPVPEFGDADAI